LIVAGRSNPFSALLCSTISDTRVHCRSENRSLKLVVSGSLASSTMLPTELAVSDSVSDMLLDATTVVLVNAQVFRILQKNCNESCRRVKLPMVGEGSAVSVCFCGRGCGVGSSGLPYLLYPLPLTCFVSPSFINTQLITVMNPSKLSGTPHKTNYGMLSNIGNLSQPLC
jgi:hypothetical protein